LDLFSKRTAHGAVQPPPVYAKSGVGLGITSSFLQEIKIENPRMSRDENFNNFINLELEFINAMKIIENRNLN
jgi:hypothetical protein